MSVINFELRDEHIKLLKHLRWSISEGLIVSKADEEDTIPFGGNSLYEGMSLILDGKPEIFDPFNTSDLEEYPVEKKTEWDKLYSELPLALEIIHFTQDFRVGFYRCSYHDRIWKRSDS